MFCIIAVLAVLGYCIGSLVAARLAALKPRAALSGKARARLRQLVDAWLQRESGMQLCRREGAQLWPHGRREHVDERRQVGVRTPALSSGRSLERGCAPTWDSKECRVGTVKYAVEHPLLH